MAVPDARHGGGIDGSRVEPESSAAVPRAAVVTAAGGVSGGECGNREDEWTTCALSQGKQSERGVGNTM